MATRRVKRTMNANELLGAIEKDKAASLLGWVFAVSSLGYDWTTAGDPLASSLIGGILAVSAVLCFAYYWRGAYEEWVSADDPVMEQ